jgi:carbamoyltransferase
MASKKNLLKIPKSSIIGINYSKMHDSALTVINAEGDVIFSQSLERITRVKQDGRFILDYLDFNLKHVSLAVVSVSKRYVNNNVKSKHHNVLKIRTQISLKAPRNFFKELNSIPVKIKYINHHRAHAESSFWPSGFDEAFCLVYDGGMINESIFGGIYKANLRDGVKIIDEFNANIYANITHLYSAITAYLGFTPLKHEGKITGLAAHGAVNRNIENIMQMLLKNSKIIDNLIYWKKLEFGLSNLGIDNFYLLKLKKLLDSYRHEDIAATLQKITENHVIEILKSIYEISKKPFCLCLSGGLFANVKLNQKISELKFVKNLYIAPAMTDDGTSLGAAFYGFNYFNKKLNKFKLENLYLGKSLNKLPTSLLGFDIKINHFDDVGRKVAELLSMDKIVAVYQGNSEFGPRALGNRSILGSARSKKINQIINQKLFRTEFMPFAPIVRDVNFNKNFNLPINAKDNLKFMTITVNCKSKAIKYSPAVVHVDGTARPQVVNKNDNPLIYDILRHYEEITNLTLLINTSFNVHEEPIVNSFEDAIVGQLVAGIDYLYIENYGLIDKDQNHELAVEILRDRLKNKTYSQ